MANAPENPEGFPGAIRLFRAAGINVYLHWSWAVVALIMIQGRADAYSAPIWGAAEYVTLFAIVLMHEFGHALACRSVGGRADRILLWPLGGIAYVNPPRRPGAVLWSIAAGPLVNVVLVPVTLGVLIALNTFAPSAPDDLVHYVDTVAIINIGLLVFNLLPIYPLDGGQIVQSILWSFLGLPRSLTIAATIGMIGAAGVIIMALMARNVWLIVIAVFGISQSWSGLLRAAQLRKALKVPRHAHLSCPACHEAPPSGPLWPCRCPSRRFDAFAYGGVCPFCGVTYPRVFCPFCGEVAPPAAWFPPAAAAPPPPEPVRHA
ncbi:MAG: peptidase M50 [Planctomycetota bacterium]|nr:MAG: peptidase M50 [Planctomycetota bacterium]